MKVYKHKIVARFGLMHMVGTNLSVWLNVLVQETKHEILTFYDPENKTIGLSHRLGKTHNETKQSCFEMCANIFYFCASNQKDNKKRRIMSNCIFR